MISKVTLSRQSWNSVALISQDIRSCSPLYLCNQSLQKLFKLLLVLKPLEAIFLMVSD